MEASDAKVCPDCAEEVKAAARVCRFCGYRFDAAETAPAPTEDSSSPERPDATEEDTAEFPRVEGSVITADPHRPDDDSADADADWLAPYRARLEMVQERFKDMYGDLRSTKWQRRKLSLGVSMFLAGMKADSDEVADFGKELMRLHPLILAGMNADHLVKEFSEAMVESGLPEAVRLREDKAIKKLGKRLKNAETTHNDLELQRSRLPELRHVFEANVKAVAAALEDDTRLPFPRYGDDDEPTKYFVAYAHMAEEKAGKWLALAERTSGDSSEDDDTVETRGRRRLALIADGLCDGAELSAERIILYGELEVARRIARAAR
jgi:hypothetical protein